MAKTIKVKLREGEVEAPIITEYYEFNDNGGTDKHQILYFQNKLVDYITFNLSKTPELWETDNGMEPNIEGLKEEYNKLMNNPTCWPIGETKDNWEFACINILADPCIMPGL